MVIMKVADEDAVVKRMCDLIEYSARQAIKKKDVFYVGVSGGSLIEYLCKGLPNVKTEWKKWILFFCDERIVPESSEDSTFGMYKSKLLSKVPLLESQFVTIKQGVDAEAAAEDYRKKITSHFGEDELPRFNLLLLGMGPDGHTCSLFPNHPLLKENKLTVAAIVDSPKPPPERITLTYPVINNAECCIFAICGDGKADMLKKILTDEEDLPAGRVKPKDGVLYWILDMAAAKLT